MIKKILQKIKIVFKKSIAILGIGAVALGAITQVNITPSSHIDYPIFANTDIEKLEFLYLAEETLRLEHNDFGANYINKIITEKEWKGYLKTFDKKSREIGYEIAVLREKIGYATESDILKVKIENEEAKQFRKSQRWNVDLNKILKENIAEAATENFTTYTENDPNSDYTVTSSKIDISTIQQGVTAYIYDDKGVNFFSGDFTHEFEFYINASTVDGQRTGTWAMANAIEDIDALQGASESFFTFEIGDETGAGVTLVRLSEFDSGTQYSDTNSSLSEDTLYYARSVRDEAVGTYGTIYNYVYTDAARTSLAVTLTVTLHTSKKDFRYIYGAINDGRTGTATFTGYIQNLDLSPGAVSAEGFNFIQIISEE